MLLMSSYKSFAVPSSLFDLVCLGGTVTLDEMFVVDFGRNSSTIIVGPEVVDRISWRDSPVVV